MNNTNSLEELRARTHAATLGATAKPPRAHQSCEIVARLEAVPVTENGQLNFRATALFDGPHTPAGQMDTYVVRPDRVRECLENLNKGAGAQPGSVLVFGNAWRDQQTDTVSIGWVTTALSAQKAQAGLNGHQHRRVVAVYAQMPVLEFTNTRPEAGEPTRIRWALGLDHLEARVNTGREWRPVTFDRPWLTAKLEAAWEARQQESVQINLRLPVLYPDQAVAVRDLPSATNGLVRLLAEHPYRGVLTRVGDGQRVETRWQPLMRGQDAAEWTARLLAQTPGFDDRGQPVCDPETGEQVLVDAFSLIEGIDNRLLFAAAQAGQVQVEFLPRESLLVATKKAPGLANDVKSILQAASNTELYQIAFAFGADPTAVSRVALVLQDTDDRARTYVVAGPHRLEPGPTFTVASVPSPHLQTPVGPPAPDEPPLEEAHVADDREDESAAPPIPPVDDPAFELDLDRALSPDGPSPTPADAPTSREPRARAPAATPAEPGRSPARPGAAPAGLDPPTDEPRGTAGPRPRPGSTQAAAGRPAAPIL